MAEAEPLKSSTAKSKVSFTFHPGDAVEALYRGEWCPGKVVKVSEEIIHVIYTGFESDGAYPIGRSSVRLKVEKPTRDWERTFPSKPKQWTTELEQTREAGLPDTFFASIPGPPNIMDRMTNLGIYAIPMVGFYPYMTQFEIQPKCIIEAPGENIRLPQEIHDEFVKRRIPEFQFFFVVNDVSNVIHIQKQKKPINLINHTWIHPIIEMGSKLGYGSKWLFGLYGYEDSGVGPVPDRVDLSMQTLSKYELHIHSQKGGMCLSPNNCKFMVHRQCPVSSFWTVALEDIDTRKPRCSVTLHWLLNQRWPELDDFFGNSKTVSELLSFFHSMVESGRDDAPLLSLLFSFGLVDSFPFKPQPIAKKVPPKQRNNKKKNKKDQIECERCGKMLGGNLEAHQRSKKCQQIHEQRMQQGSQDEEEVLSKMFF